MFGKAQAYASHAFGHAKHHIARAYVTGRKFAQKLDAGYAIYKRLHGALAPALKDIAPAAVQHSKKAMDAYDKTRAHVMGAHESAERVVHSVKKAVPELGI